MQNSVLLIDKPTGITSSETINRVKRIIGVRRIGHSGTLDKWASGLLVVCTGVNTRLTRFFLDHDKRYTGIFRLGLSTDTGDREGVVIEEKPVPIVDDDLIDRIERNFTGVQMQMPPEYSALKISGRRASDLVRAGKVIYLEPRRIEIRRISLQQRVLDPAFLSFDISCTKGTYIRAIGRDIGAMLGCGAYLTELRRIESGGFSVENAVTLAELESVVGGGSVDKRFNLSASESLADFGLIIADGTAETKIKNGSFFVREQVKIIKRVDQKPYCITNENRTLIAIADIDCEAWNIRYYTVFN